MHGQKPCGKCFNEYIYIHKDYAHLNHRINMNLVHKLEEQLPIGFSYTMLRYYKYSTENYCEASFISSPNFDKEQEPIVGDAWFIQIKEEVDKAGQMIRREVKRKFTKQKKNPQIYHHKWVFVPEDHPGFDWLKSKKWSEKWQEAMKKLSSNGITPKYAYSKIGYKDYWNWFLKDAKL